MLELALAAKHFGQRPSDLYGLDTTEYWVCSDFDRMCSLRLVLWDAYLAEKRSEAIKKDASAYGNIPPHLIPELDLHSN